MGQGGRAPKLGLTGAGPGSVHQVGRDEDMTHMDMTMVVKYKVSSFLYLHNNFGYNLLGSTCTCQSLIVGTN